MYELLRSAKPVSPSMLERGREHPKMKIALGAAGLLLFIVGVKKTFELQAGDRRVEVGEADVKVHGGAEAAEAAAL